MERSVLSWVCVCALVALPLVGCSDETAAAGGTGGSGGSRFDGGSGGSGGSGGDGGRGGMGGVFACTEQGIRDAIAEGGGPHTFDCDGPQTVMTEAEIIIDNDVILDGEGNLTVDGDDDHRVFSVAEGVTAELRGLTVTRGRDDGGGILNVGTLTLTNSTVSGNTSSSGKTPEGGGIINGGTLTLTNSTVSGNNASIGGGISNSGTLTLTNSTVSGNGEFAFAVGGGILNTGTLTLTNSTVSGNLGSAIYDSGGTLTVTNTLIDGDCFGAVTSNGHNIESPGDTCGFNQGTDQTGVTEGQLNLGPLQDNGGPTMTHALGADSVAIDHIPADMCEVDEDQRGEPRLGGTMCDVGSFEVQP